MFEDPKAHSLGTILVFIEAQHDFNLLPTLVTFYFPSFVFIPFAMMRGKDNGYN
jgi:hypothetical protein